MKAEKIERHFLRRERRILDLSPLLMIGAAMTLVYPPFTFAEFSAEPALTPPSSTWNLLKEKFRFRTFSEFMTPAFQGNTSSVPTADGEQFVPVTGFNIFWMDYRIAENYRLVYWQRINVALTSNDSTQAMSTLVRNPRFGFRRTQLFNTPNLTTTYDLYIQPGIAQESAVTGKSFELGFRTNTSYTIPKSRWNIGSITEANAVFYKQDGSSGSDSYAWAMPWTSYDLTSKFSTQHWVTLPLQHKRGTPWGKILWDDPGMPFIQNGVSMNVSETVWTSVFINNYLLTTPTLKNTWASLWLSLSIL